jgi:hypothetical protein
MVYGDDGTALTVEIWTHAGSKQDAQLWIDVINSTQAVYSGTEDPWIFYTEDDTWASEITPGYTRAVSQIPEYQTKLARLEEKILALEKLIQK